MRDYKDEVKLRPIPFYIDWLVKDDLNIVLKNLGKISSKALMEADQDFSIDLTKPQTRETRKTDTAGTASTTGGGRPDATQQHFNHLSPKPLAKKTLASVKNGKLNNEQMKAVIMYKQFIALAQSKDQDQEYDAIIEAERLKKEKLE